MTDRSKKTDLKAFLNEDVTTVWTAEGQVEIDIEEFLGGIADFSTVAKDIAEMAEKVANPISVLIVDDDAPGADVPLGTGFNLIGVPVLVGTLADTAVVYSRQLVRYGALPATYLYQPGAVSWLSVTMLTGRQLARMDETEGLGRAYLRIKVPGYFHVDGGPSVGDLAAYLDRKILTYEGTPVRLKLFAREGPGWLIMDEREVLSLVFDQADLLLGEAIEGRHNRLLTDKLLWQQLVTFLEGQMSGLKVDEAGRLMNA
ncbi:MAG: hypothetical protein IIA72_08015 [Proteobacteria bacterium]|nr:hypothetical protein [Pseudomonadota bacterium]